MSDALTWQSLLFVPAGADRLLASAIRHRPDAVIIDLEDAIAAGDKADARRMIPGMLEQLAGTGIATVVRVNAPLALMVEDIASLDLKTVSALLLPKVESKRPVENAVELTGGGIAMIALIETPGAIDAIPRISTGPKLAGLMLGSEDLSAAMGVSPDNGVLDLPAARLAFAAAARGLLAIGFPGSIGNFKNLDLYRQQIERGRNLGMNAVAAIHPLQLPVIRQSLMPSPDEISWARSVLHATQTGNKAVSKLDGMMIDAPVLARARRLLARAGDRVG